MKEYKHTVQYYETDKMGITHHSNYIRWMEEARVSFLSSIGWPFEKLEKEGIVSPVLSLEIKYAHSTTFADVVIIKTKLSNLSYSRMEVGYEMTKENGEIVATALSSHGFLNANGRPINLKKDYLNFYETLSKEIS